MVAEPMPVAAKEPTVEECERMQAQFAALRERLAELAGACNRLAAHCTLDGLCELADADEPGRLAHQIKRCTLLFLSALAREAREPGPVRDVLREMAEEERLREAHAAAVERWKACRAEADAALAHSGSARMAVTAACDRVFAAVETAAAGGVR